MRRAPRLDANQRELEQYFRANGCAFQSLAGVGQGCADAIVGWPYGATSQKLALLELKTRTGKLRPKQVTFAEKFAVHVVRTEADADRVIARLKGA